MAKEDTGMSNTYLGLLVASILCSGMIGYGLFRSPIKTPMSIGGMLLCCCLSSSSTGTVVKDIQKKI
jgi:hypothetical protein